MATTPTSATPQNRRLALAKPAVRAGQKARIALSGPSGSGKTWSSLSIATEFAGAEGKILLIDTEEGSGALYADKFTYDHLVWAPPYDPRELTDTLRQAGEQYAVVIIDSLSHFWDDEGGTLDIVDSFAQRSTSGNTFAAWKQGTPIQKDMVRAFLRCAAHVIVTMRAKTEYVIEETVTASGRKTTAPKRIGVTPVQRAGLEYEFTILGQLGLDHQLVIDKSRCDEVADKRYQPKKEREFAKALKTWLDSAAPQEIPAEPAAAPTPAPATTPDELAVLLKLASSTPSGKEKTAEAVRKLVEDRLSHHGKKGAASPFEAVLSELKKAHAQAFGDEQASENMAAAMQLLPPATPAAAAEAVA